MQIGRARTCNREFARSRVARHMVTAAVGGLLICSSMIAGRPVLAAELNQARLADQAELRPSPPADLKVTFYGVSTLMFDDGEARLLIDGFFSRPSVLRLLFTPIGARADRVSEGLGASETPLLGVLVAHAHHDHALDIGEIARQAPEAIVLGTPSVARLAEARGVAAQRVRVAADGEVSQIGPYRVTAFYAPHGPSPRLLRWLLDHPLKADLVGPAWFGRYKDNQNLSYLIEHGQNRILIHPSAGVRDLTDLRPDAVFLGVAQLGGMPDDVAQRYLAGLIGPTVKHVTPVHWDRFTTPLGKRLRPMPSLLDDVDAAFKRVCAAAGGKPDVRVVQLQGGEQMTFRPVGHALGGAQLCQ